MYFYTAELVILVSQIVLVTADGSSLPLWKTQLTHYRQWKGYYVYQDKAHDCKMSVRSVQEEAHVSFSADNSTLDMTAYSSDGVSIIFKTEAIFQPSDHFYDNFQFVMELMQYGNLHVFLGNITHPTSNFSTIKLQPEGSWMRNHVKSSDKSIRLAVGVSLSLFVVCTVIGIVILRWAIRKGYLRHVAMSYKNFRNPESAAEPPVSFSNAQEESRPDEVNVHI
ncbi:hypothetical protein ACOMHN_014631 [Nucella lapillus]